MAHDTLTVQKHGRDYVFFYEAFPGKVYLHKNAYVWHPGADEGRQVPTEEACEELNLLEWEIEDRIHLINDGEAGSWVQVK